MPVSYEFDGSMLALRMVGSYEPADVRKAIADALREAGGRELTGLLFDVTASDALARRSANEVRAMAAFLAHVAPSFGNRIALVATNDVGYGLMRLGAVDLESAGVAPYVFRDVAAALAWLGR
jgi:hypothetical protein